VNGNKPEEEAVQVLPEGQYIKHQQYGMGVVTASDPERTTIEFEAHGRKVFVTSLMNAELVGETPAKPNRPRRNRKAPVARAAATARRR